MFGRDSSVNCYLDVEIGAATLVADWVYICDFDHRTRTRRRHRAAASDQGPGPGQVAGPDRTRLLAGRALDRAARYDDRSRLCPRRARGGAGELPGPERHRRRARPGRPGPGPRRRDPPRDPAVNGRPGARVWGRSPSSDRVSSAHPQVASGLMDIVVCVKYVPDAQAQRTFTSGDNTTDRVGVDGLLSELDEYAVEEALKLSEANREQDGESSVTVLTVGPEQAETAIRKSLQMGADKAVHVKDDALHGSDADRHVTGPGPGDREDRPAGPGPDRHGLDRRHDVRRTGHAGRAARTAPGDVRQRADRRRRPGHDPPGRRHLDRDRHREPAGRRQRDRPDQRAALPVVQGDHGGQEEAGRGVVARRHRGRRRTRSAWPRPGPRSSRSPPGRRARRARSSPTTAPAATSWPSTSPPTSSSRPARPSSQE